MEIPDTSKSGLGDVKDEFLRKNFTSFKAWFLFPEIGAIVC